MLFFCQETDKRMLYTKKNNNYKIIIYGKLGKYKLPY